MENGNIPTNPRIRLENGLTALGMEKMREGLQEAVDAVNSGSLTLVEALAMLVDRETKEKEERAQSFYIKMAHLPFGKTFDDFDFTFQPTLNKEQVLNLQYLGFMENGENIIFVGSPGVGKTHLASSIALYAARQKKSVYFTAFSDMVMALKKAKYDGTLDRKMRQFSRYHLLVIDEIGFMPIDREGAELFFQIASRRYEKKSTVITTNKPLSKWAEIFGDAVLANAILDRLLYHCKTFKIIGRSYRTREYSELEKTQNQVDG